MPKATGLCAIAECGRKVNARGWCAAHYFRWKKYGDPLAGPPFRKPRGAPSRPCSAQDCAGFARVRDWCDKHYRRWLHNGAPDAFAPRPAPTPAQLAALDAGRRAPKSKLSDEERVRRNRAAGRRYQREFRAKFPEEARRMRRESMAKYGPEYRQRWNHYNRLRRRGLDQPDELSVEYSLILRGDPCCYCGAPMGHVDHIEPLARGGTGAWHNLTAACARCNFEKQARPLLLFMLSRVA